MSEPELPEGDILIHAGDLTFGGKIQEVLRQLNWLEKESKKFKKVILVPGNHDFFFRAISNSR